MRSFFADDRAVTSIEYALIGALIAVVIFVTVTSLGIELQKLWSKIAACVGNPGTC